MVFLEKRTCDVLLYFVSCCDSITCSILLVIAYSLLTWNDRICAGRKTRPNKRAKQEKGDPTSAFFWFVKENGLRVADSLGQVITSGPVRTELQRLWKVMNALERKPYMKKAERVQALKAPSKNDAEDSDNGGKKSAEAVAAST